MKREVCLTTDSKQSDRKGTFLNSLDIIGLSIMGVWGITVYLMLNNYEPVLSNGHFILPLGYVGAILCYFGRLNNLKLW